MAAILSFDEYQAYLQYKQARTARFARLHRAAAENAAFDLALLTSPKLTDTFPTVTGLAIADSDAVQVGQKVIAIGNPFSLEFTGRSCGTLSMHCARYHQNFFLRQLQPGALAL